MVSYCAKVAKNLLRCFGTRAPSQAILMKKQPKNGFCHEKIGTKYKTLLCYENLAKQGKSCRCRVSVSKQSSAQHQWRKSVGEQAEAVAAAYLSEHGLDIVATNYHVLGAGEIDIIAVEQCPHRRGVRETLVFVEVRARKHGDYATSLETITPTKQKRIIKTAEVYLQRHPHFANHDCRFDVIGFDFCGQRLPSVQEICWIKGAFLAE